MRDENSDNRMMDDKNRVMGNEKYEIQATPSSCLVIRDSYLIW